MMKAINILALGMVILLFTSFTKPAESELKWYGWNEGYPLAKKEGKLILVDAYTDWCGWCKKMDRDTYANADVIKNLKAVQRSVSQLTKQQTAADDESTNSTEASLDPEPSKAVKSASATTNRTNVALTRSAAKKKAGQ
jgi:thiol:disulfide interchange protein